MKRFSAPPGVYADPTRPPDDDESDASSLSDGSKKVKTAQSFESLFNSESLSDIVLDINGGEYIFHAHKMIVGLKSERLAALITNVATVPHDNSGGKPVLYLQEPHECSAVFSRFLYFIYSGAVWLHRDYVIPLFKLSIKYGVGALATHCENYIHQILDKMLAQDPASPLTQSLSIGCVCDLLEDSGYRDETKKTAFRVLCLRFPDFVRTDRWINASWQTVRDLLRSDDCVCEENLILVSATDWMKRNKLQDKARIQEILSSIRYPSLPRRVLYHLHATSSFKKFPPVQDLIDAAIRYHCFKDVPEAQAEFTSLQYRVRGFSTTNRTARDNYEDDNCENNSMCITGVEDNNNTVVSVSVSGTPDEICCSPASSSLEDNNNIHHSTTWCQFVGGDGDVGVDDEHHCAHHKVENQNNQFLLSNSSSISSSISANHTLSTLPIRQRSKSEDRYGSLQRGDHDHRLRHPPNCRQPFLAPESSVSSFHSPRSPVAAVQPRVQGRSRRNSTQGGEVPGNVYDQEDRVGVVLVVPPPPSNSNNLVGTSNNNDNNTNISSNSSSGNPHQQHLHHHHHHQHQHHHLHHHNVVSHSQRRGDHKTP